MNKQTLTKFLSGLEYFYNSCCLMSCHIAFKINGLDIKKRIKLSYFQVLFCILDGFNMLQGLFIFLVFFWKPSMLKKIQRRHPKFSKPLVCLLKLFCRNVYHEIIFDSSDVPNIQSRIFDNNMIRVTSCDNFSSS